MSEEILNKLKEHDVRFDEHDANFVQINRRFDEHDAKFSEHDRRFDKIDTQIEFLAEKVADHDGKLDFLIQKVTEHDTRFDRIEATMATKDDLRKITDTLDYLVKLSEKHDQEMLMMSHGMFRMNDRIDVLEKKVGIT